ncbi:MAG TPA: ABC transporter substrate-binding protein [Geminicoccaceae bacterium]|nr:ABC transporter substrate-binding protein [Geminicoccaceae bacterium]
MKRACVRWRRREALGLLATVAVLPLIAPALAVQPARGEVTPAEAEAAVRDLAAEIWRVLGRADLGDQGRVDAITLLLDEATDVGLLSRLVLGRYWQQLDEQQRVRYQALFRDVVMRNFASRLNQQAKDAHGPFAERFVIASSAPAGKQDVLVRSRVRPESRDTIAVDWRLRGGDHGPVIIDVIIQGVSLLVSQRSEFAAVIERSDIKGLLAELEARASPTKS